MFVFLITLCMVASFALLAVNQYLKTSDNFISGEIKGKIYRFNPGHEFKVFDFEHNSDREYSIPCQMLGFFQPIGEGTYFLEEESGHDLKNLCSYSVRLHDLKTIVKWRKIEAMKRVGNGFIIVESSLSEHEKDGILKYQNRPQEILAAAKEYAGEDVIYFMGDDGQNIGLYSGDVKKFYPYNISPDGSKIAYFELSEDKRLWSDKYTSYYYNFKKGNIKIYNLQTETEELLCKDIALFRSQGKIIWSPDSKKLAFECIQNENHQEYEQIEKLDPSNMADMYTKLEIGTEVYDMEESKSQFVKFGICPIWRNDSLALLVSRYDALKNKISILDIKNGLSKDIFLKGQEYSTRGIFNRSYNWAAWSPDGKYVAYQAGPSTFDFIRYLYASWCNLAALGSRIYWVWIKDVSSENDKILTGCSTGSDSSSLKNLDIYWVQ